MNAITAVAVYLVGIVLGIIGFGAWMKPTRHYFDTWDFIMILVIVVLWPILLVVAAGLAIVVGVIFVVLFKPLQILFYKSGAAMDRISNWWDGRRKNEDD